MTRPKMDRWLTIGLVSCLVLIVLLAVSSVSVEGSPFTAAVGLANVTSAMAAVGSMAVFFHQRRQRNRIVPIQEINDALAHILRQVETAESASLALLLGNQLSPHLGIAAFDTSYHYWHKNEYGHEIDAAGSYASIYRVFEEAPNQRLIILGEPGSGKTVMALNLALQIVRRVSLGDNLTYRVPVRLNLTRWRLGQPITAWLVQELIERFAVGRAVAQAIVRSGRLILILDGLDEVESRLGAPARATRVIDDLSTYALTSPTAAFVVTSRTETYRSVSGATERLPPCTEVCLDTLTRVQSVRFLELALSRRPTQFDVLTDLWRLRENMDSGAAYTLLGALSTPWRLQLSLVALRGGLSLEKQLAIASVASASPSSSDVIVKRLLSLYVSSAVSSSSDPRFRDVKKVNRYLSNLAAVLAKQVTAGQSATDFMPSQLWRAGGNGIPRFLHSLTVSAPFFVGEAAVIWTGISWIRSGEKPSWLAGISIAAVVGLAVFLVLSWSVYKSNPEPSGLSIRYWYSQRWEILHAVWNGGTELKKSLQYGFGALAILLAGIAILTYIGGATVRQIPAVLRAFFFPLGALTVGFSLASVFIDRTVETLYRFGLLGTSVGAHHWLRSLGTQVVSVILGFGLGILAVGLDEPFFYWGDLDAAGLASVGILGAVVAGWLSSVIVACGGPFVLRYGFGIVIAKAFGRVPFRLRSFLEWAVRTEILRISGQAYQFRHKQLLDWLIDA